MKQMDIPNETVYLHPIVFAMRFCLIPIFVCNLCVAICQSDFKPVSNKTDSNLSPIEYTSSTCHYEFTHPNHKLIMPKFSPNGEYILCTSEDRMGLYVIDACAMKVKSELLTNFKVGFYFGWKNNNRVVCNVRLSNQWVTHAIDINSGDTSLLSINPKTLDLQLQKMRNPSGNFSYSIDPQSLQIIQHNHSTGRNIEFTSKDQGRFYSPLPSPKGNYLAAHRGSNLVIFDVKSGEILLEKQGIATSWHPNENHIAFFLDESSDGHHITGSGVYFMNIKSGKILRSIKTDQIQMWPDIAPDGNSWVYSCNKSGKIIVNTLELLR